MDTFLRGLSTPLSSLVCKYIAWFSRCVGFFGGRKGADCLSFFAPCSPLLSWQSFPHLQPSRREHFNFKPRYNQPQANPTLAPGCEAFPLPTLPPQASCSPDGCSRLSLAYSLRPVPARGREAGGEQRRLSGRGSGTEQHALIPSSSAPTKSLTPAPGDLPLPAALASPGRTVSLSPRTLPSPPSMGGSAAPRPALRLPAHGAGGPLGPTLGTPPTQEGPPQPYTLPPPPTPRRGPLSAPTCPPSPQPGTHYL